MRKLAPDSWPIVTAKDSYRHPLAFFLGALSLFMGESGCVPRNGLILRPEE